MNMFRMIGNLRNLPIALRNLGIVRLEANLNIVARSANGEISTGNLRSTVTVKHAQVAVPTKGIVNCTFWPKLIGSNNRSH